MALRHAQTMPRAEQPALFELPRITGHPGRAWAARCKERPETAADIQRAVT